MKSLEKLNYLFIYVCCFNFPSNEQIFTKIDECALVHLICGLSVVLCTMTFHEMLKTRSYIKRFCSMFIGKNT